MKRSASLLSGIAASLAVLSSPAAADGPTVSAERRLDNVRAAQTFAACVVERFPAQARDVVRQDLPNEQVREDHDILMSERCARTAGLGRVRMAFPGSGFKYALGEALVRADGPTASHSFDAVPALSWRAAEPANDATFAGMTADQRAAAEARAAQQHNDFVLANIGECVARANPAAVRDTAFRTHDVAEYQDAIQPLIANLQTCLPEGTTVRLRPDQLRGAALYAYARLALALSSSGGAQ